MKNDIPHGYTRVTDVLKPYTDFSMIDPHTLQAAADRGTRVHHYCEMHALDLFITDVDADCKNYFDCFKEWFDNYVQEVIHAEIRLNSPTLKLSGQADLICVLRGDDKPSLIDLKTPQNASRTWFLQSAAYKVLCKECINLEVDRRICLMLRKDTSNARIIEFKDHDTDEKLFMNAFELYKFMKLDRQ